MDRVCGAGRDSLGLYCQDRQQLARNLPGSVKEQRGSLTRYISELFLLLPDLGKPSKLENKAVYRTALATPGLSRI